MAVAAPALAPSLGALGSTMAAGGLSSVANYAVYNTYMGEKVTLNGMVSNFVTGAVIAGLFYGAEKLIGKGLNAVKEHFSPANRYMRMTNKLDVSTPKNSAVFYSGKGNKQIAESFAKENGKMTLEMTKGGKYLDNLDLFGVKRPSPLNGDQAAQVWGNLSQRYASQASGNVYGFVNGSRSGSIFNSVEYPALMNNSKITNIFTFLMQ